MYSSDLAQQQLFRQSASGPGLGLILQMLQIVYLAARKRDLFTFALWQIAANLFPPSEEETADLKHLKIIRRVNVKSVLWDNVFPIEQVSTSGAINCEGGAVGAFLYLAGNVFFVENNVYCCLESNKWATKTACICWLVSPSQPKAAELWLISDRRSENKEVNMLSCLFIWVFSLLRRTRTKLCFAFPQCATSMSQETN